MLAISIEFNYKLNDVTPSNEFLIHTYNGKELNIKVARLNIIAS